MQKLYALVNDKCAPESPDNPMNQELLLGGHLYLMVIKVNKERNSACNNLIQSPSIIAADLSYVL